MGQLALSFELTWSRNGEIFRTEQLDGDALPFVGDDAMPLIVTELIARCPHRR